MGNTIKPSTYYITTANTIQAAVQFTLIWDNGGADYKIKIDVYNGDPATVAPKYSKTQTLGQDDIFNFGTVNPGAGEVYASGAFTKREYGVEFFGELQSPYANSSLQGFIGAFQGGGPDMSKGFQFAKGKSVGFQECQVFMELGWNDTNSAYDVHWSFDGASGVTSLDQDGAGTLTHMKNGVEINGTFSRDISYRFNGVFVKPDVIQFGFKDACYSGWQGKSHHIRE